PGTEGADDERADRPQGLWRGAAEGRVSPDPQGQEFRARHRRDPRLGPPASVGECRHRRGCGVVTHSSLGLLFTSPRLRGEVARSAGEGGSPLAVLVKRRDTSYTTSHTLI